MDALLDLSEGDDHSQPPGDQTNTARDSFASSNPSHDPFDPFATQHDLQPSKGESSSDPFDPFATITSDPTSPDADFFGGSFSAGHSILEPSTDQLVEQNQSGLDFFGTVDDSSNPNDPDLTRGSDNTEQPPSTLHHDLADFLGGNTNSESNNMDTQMNGHVANGDIMNGDTLVTETTTTSSTHMEEYSEESQGASFTNITCTPASPTSSDNSAQDNPTQSASISPPTSDRQSVTESGYDDLLGDFGEGAAPKADMDSELDLSPAVTPADLCRTRDQEVPNGSAEECSDIEMEQEKAGTPQPAEDSSDEETNNTFIEKDLSVPEHLEDIGMSMLPEDTTTSEPINSNNNPQESTDKAHHQDAALARDDANEKEDIDEGHKPDLAEREDLPHTAESQAATADKKTHGRHHHKARPEVANDSSSDDEDMPRRDMAKVTFASRVLEADRDYISSEDERMVDQDEHEDTEPENMLRVAGCTAMQPHSPIDVEEEPEVVSSEDEARLGYEAQMGAHGGASTSRQEDRGYISSEEERSVDHVEHDDAVEGEESQGHVSHLRSGKPDTDAERPDNIGGAKRDVVLSTESMGTPLTPLKVTELWPPEDPAKRLEAREQRRKSSHASAEEFSEGVAAENAAKSKDDKKALDYMKQFYTGTQEKSREKIIREPKKLDIAWGKNVPETEETKKEPKALPKEQDLVAYTSVGLDYSKQKYESAVAQEEKAAALAKHTSSHIGNDLSPSTHGTPVNWQEVEKVAPPEITRNVLALFEKGEFSDLHQAEKLNPVEDLYTEGSVCESTPEVRQDVVHCSDVNLDGEELQPGFTQNLLRQWSNQGEKKDSAGGKEQIVMDLAQDHTVSESQPEQRTDVVREADSNLQEELAALSLRDRMAMLTQEKPKERKEIKLVEDGQSEIILENEPTVRDDVIREGDTQEEINFKLGHIKNLSTFFDTKTDEPKERKQIIIDRSTGPTVRENQPEVREGVVREHDVQEDEKALELEQGHARKLASRWSGVQEEDLPGKKPFQMDLANEAGELESTPTVRTDVVKCDEAVEDVIPGEAGRSRKLAEQFLKAAETASEEKTVQPRRISIDKDAGYVAESNPEERSDVVKSGGPTGWEIEVEHGRTRSLADCWLQAAEETTSPKKDGPDSSHKPAWLQEIEAAKESGVYENQPEQREDLVREEDNYEQADMIPEQHTRNLKNLWLNREAEDAADDAAAKSRAPQVTGRKWSRPEVKMEPEPEPEPEPPKKGRGRGKKQAKKAEPEPASNEIPGPKRNFVISRRKSSSAKDAAAPAAQIAEEPEPDPGDFMAVLRAKKRAKQEAAMAEERARLAALEAEKRQKEDEKRRKSADDGWIKKRAARKILFK